MHPEVGSHPFNASWAAFLAVLFGVKLIWPSETTSNAPDWYITPEIVFGKFGFETRFKTTAATATCPLYGSPLASAYTNLLSKFRLLELLPRRTRTISATSNS